MYGLMRRGQQLHAWRKYLVQNCATVAAIGQKEKCPYDEFIRNRQVEATRSIVVQVNSERSFNELYNYCSAFGEIISAHHYHVQLEDDQHYILLEYASEQEAAAAIDSSAYNEELSGVPVRSPFLWFKASSKAGALKSSRAQSKLDIPNLNIIDGNSLVESEELNTLMHGAENINEQIQMLYQRTQLNDLGVRLRFLAALQIQEALVGMFPAANALPFGSSVNGFGKMGCDLDLILRFDRESGSQFQQRNRGSRLVFHTKENLSNGRSQTQRQMESIGDMLHLFLPGVSHVRRILQARVPIIKYHHEHMNLEVDLSMSNLSGFYMSELLYMFGELDERVRPLTFCIRRWANACGLTNPSPGRWITNFSLTCLVIFFLQQKQTQLLPTVNAIAKTATKDDIRVTEDGINCTFGRDFDRIQVGNRNTTRSVSELLLQFFEFYSQFDFGNRAISLNEGRAITKPDHSALYIVNPLEQVLNISKNVSLEECERLRIEVRNAAWVLESEVECQVFSEEDKLDRTWGLLNLFKTNEKAIIRPNMFFKSRMVDVTDLFEKSDQADEMQPSPSVPIKNSTVRKQMQNIKTQAKADLKQIRMNATDVSQPKGKRSR